MCLDLEEWSVGLRAPTSMGAWVHNRKDVNFTQYLHKPTQISLPSLSLSHSLSFSHLRTKTLSHALSISLSQSFQGRTLRSHRRSPLPPWFSFIPHCKYLLSHLPLFNIVLFICFPLILATAKPQQSQPPVMVVVYSNGLLPLFFYFLLGLGFGFSLFNWGFGV